MAAADFVGIPLAPLSQPSPGLSANILNARESTIHQITRRPVQKRSQAEQYDQNSLQEGPIIGNDDSNDADCGTCQGHCSDDV